MRFISNWTLSAHNPEVPLCVSVKSKGNAQDSGAHVGWTHTVDKPVADPGFPGGGHQLLMVVRQSIICKNFCLKLHKNERI